MRNLNDGQPISDPRGTREVPNSGYTLPRSSLFFREVRENWVVLSFVVLLIVQWTTTNIRVAYAEAQISELKQVISEISEINVNIAVMQNDIQYIKKNL